MGYAYIVLSRTDLPDTLQVNDLWPNSSNFVPWQTGSNQGQSGYLGDIAQNEPVVIVTSGANDQLSAAALGVRAYLVDKVASNNGGTPLVLTAVQATAIATSILGAVVAGTALTVTALDAMVVAGATAGSTFDGAGGTNSVGVVEELLRILAGEVYLVPAGVNFSGAAHAWVGTPIGSFVGPTDPNYINVRRFVNTGALHLSRVGGNLSELASASFVYDNPLKSYGGSGTALFVNGAHIPSAGAPPVATDGAQGGGVGAAVAVYDNAGNVIVN